MIADNPQGRRDCPLNDYTPSLTQLVKYMNTLENNEVDRDKLGRFVKNHKPYSFISWNKGLTKETDKRIAEFSKKMTGRISFMKGKKRSVEFKRKISLAFKGKPLSEKAMEARSRTGQLARKIIKIKDKPLFDYFVGAIQGDGWISKTGVGIVVAEKDADYKDRLIQIINKVFGINPSVYKPEKEKYYRIMIYSRNLADIMSPFKNKGKWLNTDKIRYYNYWLSGLIDTDGCIRKGRKRNSIQLTQVNKENLLLVLQYTKWSGKIYETSRPNDKPMYNLCSFNGREKKKLREYLHLQHPRKKKLLASI